MTSDSSVSGSSFSVPSRAQLLDRLQENEVGRPRAEARRIGRGQDEKLARLEMGRAHQGDRRHGIGPVLPALRHFPNGAQDRRVAIGGARTGNPTKFVRRKTRLRGAKNCHRPILARFGNHATAKGLGILIGSFERKHCSLGQVANAAACRAPAQFHFSLVTALSPSL